jgi:type II secretory pathway component PulL
LDIPKVMTLKTLADVRTLVERHLPEDRRARSIWRHVAKQLADAASGADPADAAISLRLALMIEGVECRPA